MEIMIDDFVTFFIAGQETTANALGFCFYELGRNEDIMRKAREEIDRVIGEKNEITYQDAIDLKYCSAIFKETLRLYPPAPILGRETQDEMNINGYYIPNYTPIFVF
jgi:cholesterol 24(S)-hydroxylase